MTNPYSNLADYCFWSRAMSWPAPGHIDPVVARAVIAPTDKVATIGSCFAQHLSRYLVSAGLNYYVAETAPSDMDPTVAINRNYGVFSARYGNIYTVRQAVQLFARAFGEFKPSDDVWLYNGRYVDAFRPAIEPGGFSSPDAVRLASAAHFEHARNVFLQSDWLVLTLGLTEAWRSREDGAIYPTAPGVAGGSFDTDKYEFVNFSAGDVRDDLFEFIEKIAKVNSRLRILLTVSPVPLIATYEQRHVWVSTSFSKAALRVAADEAERRFQQVVYFPSYEVITSPASSGRYFNDDLRSVTDLGVKHVMRLFKKHFIGEIADGEGTARSVFAAALATPDVICDEELIESALRRSGF